VLAAGTGIRATAPEEKREDAIEMGEMNANELAVEGRALRTTGTIASFNSRWRWNGNLVVAGMIMSKMALGSSDT
jgi:hypothetical protein